jgi:rsbT co-antagonist protein RsbR
MASTPSNTSTRNRLFQLVEKHEGDLLKTWVAEQLSATTVRTDLIKEAELREQSREFLDAFRNALQTSDLNDITQSGWTPVRDFLKDLSRRRAAQGFSPSETAMFIFSLRIPLVSLLQKEAASGSLLHEATTAGIVIDKLGLYTVEVYQKSREEVILRQQQEMLELSTPVVRLYENILALPLIGTLDSARTQIVMGNLLGRIVETGAALAIIDITGVPTVDTLVAQHLLKTVAAARLMGAECIISGIRPQIAQTIVHLGVDLGNVITKATLADAFAVALQRSGLVIRRTAPPSAGSAPSVRNGE